MLLTLLFLVMGAGLLAYGVHQLAPDWKNVGEGMRSIGSLWLQGSAERGVALRETPGEHESNTNLVSSAPSPSNESSSFAREAPARHSRREARVWIAARAGAVIGGSALVIGGMVVLRAPSDSPVPLDWLQFTLASVFKNPLNILRGTLMILAGGALFGWGVHPESLSYRHAEPNTAARRAPSPRVAAVLSAAAAVLYLVTLVRTLLGTSDLVTGVLFLGSLVVAAALLFYVSPRRTHLLSWLEIVLLALVAAAAVGWYVHDSSNWFYAWVGDEWDFYSYALYLAHGGQMNIFQQSGVYNTHPVLDSVFQASTLRVFGNSVVAWRASCAIATAVAALPLYVLTRQVASQLAAAVAVGLFLSAHVLMAYAHIGYNQPDALFPFIAALALLLVGRAQQVPGYLFLAGVAAGFGWYTFFTGRAAIPLMFLAFLIDRPRSRRAAVREILPVVAGFCLVFLPFAIVNGTSILSAMLDQTQFSSGGVAPLKDRLSQNGVRALFAFVYAQQTDNHYVSGALFDSVSAFFWILGTVVLLQWRNVRGRLILLWYWLLIIPLGALFYALHLNTTRMYILVPLACVIAGVGAASVMEVVGTLVPARARRGTAIVGAAIIITAACASNLYVFYRVTPATMGSTVADLALKEIQNHPHAKVFVAQDILHQGFPPLAAFGVDHGVVLVSGSVDSALTAGQTRGVPEIVLTVNPPLLPVPVASQHEVWDGAHFQHIVETELRP